MIIRIAQLHDLEPCVAIDAPNFNIFDRKKRRKHFLEMIPRKMMLVLEMDSRIVAMPHLTPTGLGALSSNWLLPTMPTVDEVWPQSSSSILNSSIALQENSSVLLKRIMSPQFKCTSSMDSWKVAGLTTYRNPTESFSTLNQLNPIE